MEQPEPPRPGAHGRITVLFGLGCLVTVVVRLVVFARSGEPSGVDFGDWLAYGHQWLGDGVRSGYADLYPPVVPLLAVGVDAAVGPTWGMWLLSALAALGGGTLVFAVLLRRGAGHLSLCALVVACLGTTGEPAAWGGLPQLIGLPLGGAGLLLLVSSLRTGSTRRAWQAGGAFLLLAATSQLLLPEFAIAAAVAVALVLALGPRVPLRRTPGLLARAVAPTIPAIPLYIALLLSAGTTFLSEQDYTLRGVLETARYVDPELPWQTALVVMGLAVGAPVLLLARRHDDAWAVTAGTSAAFVVAMLVRPHVRLLGLLPLLVGLGLCTAAPVLQQGMRRGRGLSAYAAYALIAAVAFTSVRGLQLFRTQQRFYSSLVPAGSTRALDWLRHDTPGSARVAVTSVSSFPFGWWVEGAGRRHADVQSSPSFVYRADQRANSAVVDDLLALGVGSPGCLARAREAGVDYLWLTADWEYSHQAELAALRQQHAGLVAYDGPGALIVKLS